MEDRRRGEQSGGERAERKGQARSDQKETKAGGARGKRVWVGGAEDEGGGVGWGGRRAKEDSWALS